MATFTGTDADEAVTPVFVSPTVLRAPWTFPTNAADLVDALGGADLVTTLGGADTVYGGDDDDSLFGGAAADTISGGYGDDTVNGGDGNDLIHGGPLPANPGGGAAQAEDFGEDFLRGGAGDDLIDGGAGDDFLIGDAGDDWLDQLGGPGGGVDEMRGGAGDDFYSISTVGDTVIELAGEGHDRVDSFIDFTLGANVEDLTLGASAAVGTGNGLANEIMGISNGVDYLLDGRGGADVIHDLSDGDSTLIGGGGNDSLYYGDRMRGGAGADVLEAGSGVNVLIGGEGQDVFRFEEAGDSAPGAVDAIVAGDGAQAFQGAGAAAGDRIDLSDFDADATLGGFQQLLWGGTGAGADTAKGRVWVVNGPGGDSLVRANIDLDAAAEFELRIADGARDATAYAASDFIVI